MKNSSGIVRVALIVVLGWMSQGCAINVPMAGMPLQAGNFDPAAMSAAPLTGPISGGLPQTGNASSLLGTPGGASTSVAGFNPGVGAASQLDAWQGGKMEPSQFFATIAPAVLESSRRTGVPAAVTLAQAALETGYGKSTVGPAKNLFGVRGVGPAGSVQGNDNGEIANFKAYHNWSDSVADHDRILSTAARYRTAMSVRNDPDAFAREIHKAGYATNSTYADKLIAIMRQYNLYAYQSNA